MSPHPLPPRATEAVTLRLSLAPAFEGLVFGTIPEHLVVLLRKTVGDSLRHSFIEVRHGNGLVILSFHRIILRRVMWGQTYCCVTV